MSGQFIGSCRTVVEVAPSKGVPNFSKGVPSKGVPSKGVPNSSKGVPDMMARHVSVLAGAPVCRLASRGARYAWLPWLFNQDEG
ncbi:unnamed protein product [Camellia sinensis]